MRILFVTGRLTKCGIGVYTQRLARELMRMGHDVMVLACPVGDDAADDVRLKVVRRDAVNGVRGAAWDEVLAFGPEVVHIQYPSLHGDAFYLYKEVCFRFWMRLPIVSTFHERPYKWRSKVLWAASSRVVTVKPVSLRDWGVCFPKRRRLITNTSMLPAVCVDDAEREAIKRKYERTHLRQVENRAAMRRLVVTFGFLTAHHRTEVLFEICAASRDDVVVVGQDPDPKQPRLEELKAICTSRGWDAEKVFRGYLPDEELASLIVAADALVLPYATGAGDWNTSLHAAQEQGVFALTTINADNARRRGMGDLLGGYEKNMNTYYCPIGDLRQMSWALNTYAGRRCEGARPMRSWADIAEEHLKVYHEVVRGDRKLGVPAG